MIGEGTEQEKLQTDLEELRTLFEKLDLELLKLFVFTYKKVLWVFFGSSLFLCV